MLNVTPDSFFDGGQHFTSSAQSGRLSVASCLQKAVCMVEQGAAFIDVGGESTRPGASLVSEQQELDRVLPVVEAVAGELDVVVSVDTSTPAVMRESAKLGAGLINDVRALSREGAVESAAATGLPVCLMHMQGSPKDMQAAPEYAFVVDEVKRYLADRVRVCVQAGIQLEKIILDPGIGFGKTDEHNLDLLRNLADLRGLGAEVLVGVSRKSMIGRLLGRDMDQRLAGSLALAQESLHRGAKIIRVHDVAETVDVVRVFNLMNSQSV